MFLYRGETRIVAERLGINTSQYPGPIIPVIYLVDFRDPAGYFLATKFAMRNKDVIYISNALSVETTKAMVYFRTIIGTLNDPIVAATNGLILRNLLATSTTVSPVFAIGGASP